MASNDDVLNLETATHMIRLQAESIQVCGDRIKQLESYLRDAANLMERQTGIRPGYIDEVLNGKTLQKGYHYD